VGRAVGLPCSSWWWTLVLSGQGGSVGEIGEPSGGEGVPGWFALVFLVTGAGLVAHLLFAVPLPVSVASAVAAAALLVTALWRAGMWASVRPLLIAGVVSGVAATAAYDLVRVVVVAATGAAVGPFGAWPLFGAALVGEASGPVWLWAAGVAFHVVNGVLFAVAFVVALRDRGPLAGVAWALVLEAAMLALYPGWLGVGGEGLGEFVQVSVLGHVAYGLVLGGVSRRLLRGGSGGG